MSSAGFDTIRRAMAELKNAEYLATNQLIPNADKNTAFILRLQSTPSPNFRIGDVDDFLQYSNTNANFSIFWVDSVSSMLSRSLMSSPQATWQMKIPPFNATKWTRMWFGFKTSFNSATSGNISFRFVGEDGVLRVAFVPWGASASQGSVALNLLTALNSVDFSSASARYSIKLRKSSAEFYYNNSLVCIAQCGIDVDNLFIRSTDPYILLQSPGLIPNEVTALFELNAVDTAIYTTDSGGTLTDLSVVNSIGKDMRFLKPYTSGTDWEGTVIGGGALISDAIPVAGFERKAVNFLANTAGNLDIYVNYGTISGGALDWDLLTTRVITANIFDQYEFTVPLMWIRLVWRPGEYDSTVTRCRVSMQE